MINIWFDPVIKKCVTNKDFYCENCNEKIQNLMWYIVNWGKKSTIDTYCFNCWDKIKERMNIVQECYPCLIKIKLPKTAIPIFLQPPTLSNKNLMTVFEVGQIIKNSEAEIIDKTRFAGRSDPNIALEIQKNKELLKQRDQELGFSHFLLSDENKQFRDDFNEKMGKGEITKALELKEEFKQSKKDINVDSLFENIKNSTLMLPEQEEQKMLE